MKDSIHEILDDNFPGCLIQSKIDASEEIDQLTREHYLKFAEWLRNHNEGKWYIKTTDQLYQFWLDNVLNK
jgi:hypothetical protein